MRVILILGLLGSALAVPRKPNRIVGGSPTNIETYPFMSQVQESWMGLAYVQVCGGSLITSTAVLTAAHCFVFEHGLRYRVVLGSSLVNSDATVHTVNRIITHPQYDDATLDSDIALVRLNNRAVFSDRIQTARIPGFNYILPDGATVTYLGWGALWYGGPGPEQLMHVDVNVINHQVCSERYSAQLPSSMVCAGILDVGGKDACVGDSGGPLVHFGDIIVGVISWGYECAHPLYPGVNARVSHFSNWIVANTQ